MIQKEEKEEHKHIDEHPIIQLIVFVAGNEEFGVPIDAVREIIKVGTITPIPDTADFIKGIINVRGEIVTTIDVKSRFSLPAKKNTTAKHMVVSKQGDSLYGLLVDEVIEVLRIQQNDLKPPPSLINQIHKKYVSGVISHNNRLIIVLDLSYVLSEKELVKLMDVTKKKKYKQHANTSPQMIDQDVVTESAEENKKPPKSKINPSHR
jgi:purine-binding chemotaxis protein CheW